MRRCFKDDQISTNTKVHLEPMAKKKKDILLNSNEPVHEISNNVVCATSKASDQPAHMRSLIRAFACRFNIL